MPERPGTLVRAARTEAGVLSTCQTRQTCRPLGSVHTDRPWLSVRGEHAGTAR